jgi:tRNA/rRNA methyltransferase
VLFRPQLAANVGSVARVMCNMGLTDLVLVAPEADITDRQARQLATHGEAILDRARIVSTLDDALADCLIVAGTSARLGGPVRRQNVALPEDVMPILVETMSSGPTALLFGPERSGLTDAEVTRCHHLIHLPTSGEYPALNLAQAVAICLYELRRTWLRDIGDPLPAADPPAPIEDQERAYENLRNALEEVGYLHGEKGPVLFHAIRHLLGRARPTTMEVRLLLGLARQIHWFVNHNKI